MKHIYTGLFFVLASLLPSLAPAQLPTNQFTNYVQGGVNSAEFTTNNFKCIGVGKGNVVWAGSQYGGLYLYSPANNIWRKSTQLTNVFINDIKPDGDSGIWVAQSGQQLTQAGSSNIAGGVNYFPTVSDLSMEFYSVAGTTTSAHLISRNAKGLYVDKSKIAANGDLPRPWVVQGLFTSGSTVRRGGLGIGLNPYWPSFTTINDGFTLFTSPGVQATPAAECIGGDGKEVWVGTRLNPNAPKILRYEPSGKYIKDGDYTSQTVPLLPSGFTAQAIFFDKFGNRWIGLKEGGLRILTPVPKPVPPAPAADGWMQMNSVTFFPPGAQVNFNAITQDDVGNVFIGTSNGLLQYYSRTYHPTASPDYMPSYKQYTTNDGLINNNVTGVAYDKKYGRLLITTSGGISFLNTSEPFIKGVVTDVYTSIDSTNNPYPGLQTKPLKGDVRVTLLKNGVEEEFVFPDANGIFELKEANDVDDYTVEVKFVKDGRPMTYVYNGIKNHTRLDPTLIPDSLILELKDFKSKMKDRCFPLQLSAQTEFNLDLFCGEAFFVDGYELAIDRFYVPITSNHQKQVYNLANYYASLKTVYKIGEQSTSLVADAVGSLCDVVDALGNLVQFRMEMNQPAVTDQFEKVGESAANFHEGIVQLLTAFKSTLDIAFTAAASAISDETARKKYERLVAACSEAADILLVMLSEGSGRDGVEKFIVENLKKIAAQAVAIGYYRDDYARTRHKNLIFEASNSAKSATSEFSYETTYDNLYNPSAESLVKYAQDTLDTRKDIVKNLGYLSKTADVASSAADAATLLALIPGTQLAAAAAKAVSLAAKAVKLSAVAAQMYQAVVGSIEIAKLSEKATEDAGLLRTTNFSSSQPSNRVSQTVTDSLVVRRNTYKQAITELQAVYPSYDVATFRAKYIAYKAADSAFGVELSKTTSTLGSAIDSAKTRIPGFTGRLNLVIDSFVSTHGALRMALRLQNFSYIIAPSKPPFVAGLDSVCNELKLATDSAVNGIVLLMNDISTNNIPSMANLVQEGFSVNHSRVPGSAGTMKYTFANRGSVAQNNVSFKIDKPTGGYNITSADSINVGTLQPGQSVQVTYAFTAPIKDSIGHYTIAVKAANGKYKDVTGVFYVVDPLKFYSTKNGNWHDPATWSSNTVPTAINPVYIYHDVTVTADGTCKSATLSHPGKIIIDTGKKLKVME